MDLSLGPISISNFSASAEQSFPSLLSSHSVPAWDSRTVLSAGYGPALNVFTFLAAILLFVPPPGPTRVILGLSFWTLVFSFPFYFTIGNLDWTVWTPQFGFLLRWFNCAVLRTAETDFYRPNVEKAGDILHEKSLWRKIQWAAAFWINWRGIGWNFETGIVVPAPAKGTSRLRFILTRGLTIACYSAFTSQIKPRIIAKFVPELLTDSGADFFVLPLATQCVVSGLYTLYLLTSVNTGMIMVSMIAVALGLSRPEEWPPHFGNFLKHANSKRNFYSRFDHQLFRHTFTCFQNGLTKVLGIPRGTLFSRYAKIYFSFFVSGLIHGAPAYLVKSPNGYQSYMFWQMFISAPIISAEDTIMWAAKKLGFRDGAYAHCVGVLWTAAWMTLIGRYVVAFCIDVGTYIDS